VNLTHQMLLKKIWHNNNPYEDFILEPPEENDQRWGSDHPYLSSAIETIRPHVVIEIGVWKGNSSISMAKKIRELDIDGTVISIDTWLGSSEHWIRDQYFPELKHKSGYPTLQRRFLSNVLSENVDDYIIPLPLDSINASVFIKFLDIQADVIHLDAGHDFRSVTADLEEWWPVLRSGGQLIGDDYYEATHWPGVKQAFQEFFSPLNLLPIENRLGKCRITKP
jgi:hypothetical protein